jgi:hypothetical protein
MLQVFLWTSELHTGLEYNRLLHKSCLHLFYASSWLVPWRPQERRMCSTSCINAPSHLPRQKCTKPQQQLHFPYLSDLCCFACRPPHYCANQPPRHLPSAGCCNSLSAPQRLWPLHQVRHRTRDRFCSSDAPAGSDRRLDELSTSACRKRSQRLRFTCSHASFKSTMESGGNENVQRH